MKILTVSTVNTTDLDAAATTSAWTASGDVQEVAEPSIVDAMAARLTAFYPYEGQEVRLYTEPENVIVLDDDPALSILLDAATVGLDGADEVSTGHSRAALDAAWDLLKALRTAVSA